MTSLLHAADAFCPASGQRGSATLCLDAGKIQTIDWDTNLNNHADDDDDDVTVMDHGVLLPGLVDLHAHPALEGSVFGVPPDEALLPHGVTTVLSQGDAGADNLATYITTTIEAAATRVKLALNLSRVGEMEMSGCFSVLSNADVEECLAAIHAEREKIWGLAVNVSHHACGDVDPREIARRGLRVAEESA